MLIVDKVKERYENRRERKIVMVDCFGDTRIGFEGKSYSYVNIRSSFSHLLAG